MKTYAPILKSFRLFCCSILIPKYQCSCCNFISHEKVQIISHDCEIEDKDVMLYCAKCNVKCFSRVWLSCHAKKCNFEVKNRENHSFECDQCTFKTKHKQWLFNHKINQHNNSKHFKNSSLQTSTLNRLEQIELDSNSKGPHDIYTVNKDFDNSKTFYYCTLCDYKNVTKYHVKNHILFEHYKKELQCNQSEKHHKASLQNHKNFLKKLKYKCDLCSYATNFKLNLETHIDNNHLADLTKMMIKYWREKEKTVCKDMTRLQQDADIASSVKQTENNLNVLDNWRSNTFQPLKKHFFCTMCDYTSSKKDELRVHELSKHIKGKKRFKCNECLHRSYRKGDLAKHIKFKHSKIDKKLKCDECYFTARFEVSLKSHKRNVHVDKKLRKMNKCSECNYETENSANLRRHVQTLHSNDEKTFKCDQCSYETFTKCSFEYHKISKHHSINDNV